MTKTKLEDIKPGDLILWADDVSKVVNVREDATLPQHIQCRMELVAESGWPTARWLRVGYYRKATQLSVADNEAEAQTWALEIGAHFMPTAAEIAGHAV